MESFTQAWFMGILFFISAFLASRSLNKRGTVAFIKERLFRLGIPLLFYMFIIAPFIYAVLLTQEHITWSYYMGYLSSFKWIGSTGPLWFVEALLLFCIIYALARPLFLRAEKARLDWFSTKNVICIILITGVIAFIIRLWFPIGSSILNLQFSYFSSYIVLFILGIITGERDMFNYITDEKNIAWFKAALIIGIPLWSIIMILGGALKGELLIYGGLYWQSFAYAIWESFVAIGFSIGILSFFKKYINADNKFTKLAAEKSFAIYVFHAPFLITITLLLKKWTMEPIIKSIAAASITCIICLIFSIVIHKIKPVKVILK
jgi:hypothetical protein